MRFLSKGIGLQVIKKLHNAVEARIAVAFFDPSEDMLDALAEVADLKLVISEEFRVNNPYKLEKLNNRSSVTLKSIPRNDPGGKLHAKVVVIKSANGTYWSLLGSANLTSAGMSSNQEACVIVEQKSTAEIKSLRETIRWFDSLFRSARVPNLDEAKVIFDNRPQNSPEPAISGKGTQKISYWALKTTSGSTGDDHWDMFRKEQVVAIGWEGLAVDPSKVSSEDLRAAVRKTYPDESKRSSGVAASTIERFANQMSVGDIVLICRGFAGKQKKPVHIYGYARVTSPFRKVAKTKGDWKFKHNAKIQVIDDYFEAKRVSSALGKGSLRRTLHTLSEAEFNQLTKKIGVPLKI